MKATVAIQGYGNAGSFAHSLVKELFGSKVAAVSDSKGGAFNAAGIEADVAARVKAETSTVANIPGKIKAKVIIEPANGPTIPEAYAILFQNKVHVIPDFLANAGGVTISYFEMVQNISRSNWTLDEVYTRLDERMTVAYQAVLAASKQYKVNMRQAAYTVAVARVVEAK
ncbi:MAG: hypothetical protein NTY37_05740 [Methanothrix sp.]|nr:hypothetical protein [Methanothrix sp.]